MEEWKEYSLGEICTKIGSGATPKGGKESYLGGGISLIRSQNVLDFTFSLDGLAFINEEQASKLDGVEIFKGDVLLNITGDSVARCCIVPDFVLPARVNQHVSIVRGDKTKVLNEYILYYLQYKKQLLLSLSQGGATRNALTKGMIEEFHILLPSIDEQSKIVSILKSLDDKIENNRKINENLEQQAQALFKSWFVDFEPFRDQPFVESELRMIPEGWRVGTLSEIADINPIRTLKKGQNAMYLDMKNMPTSGSFPIRWEKKDYTGGMKFKNQDTIMARITPCLENGKVAYINFLDDNEIAFGSTEYIVMTTKDGFMPELLYFLCRDKAFKDYATVNMNGSSGRQRVSGDVIGNYKIVIPPKNIMEPLSNYYKNVMDVIRKNGFENLNLSLLRDTLLPKLMSGEIKL